MTKNLTQTIETLSDRARSALLAAKSNRQGEKIGWSSPAALSELEDAGFITRDHNLTRRGTIVREKLLSATLDAAFS